ncbi:hypothetical protein [Natronosalvus halobius]|uniref:hypothetical protein n=1 Tax=Natronosalvus halobius TaxID=2953746 RepID=UPI0020A0F9C8|nr:hypothetical protein [Natronosalvus halobius]USZ71759.1 hypothetical protein NGM15_00180 [Natronosalvus halobius]
MEAFRFFTPDRFESSASVFRESHVDRFGDGNLPRLLEEARSALEMRSNTLH